MIREPIQSSPAPERPGDDLLNRKQLADRLKCSVRTIDRWQQEGRLPFRKPKGIVFFSWSAVQRRLSEIEVWPGQKNCRSAKKR